MVGGVVTRFLIFYFVVYGGAHLYIFLKVARGISLSRCGKLLLSALLLLLFAAPLAARNLESSAFDALAELLANAGYLWMGLLFLFITAAAAIDCCNLVLSGIRILSKQRITSLVIAPARLLLVAFAYALTIGIYGFYEATAIKTEHLTITSNRIPAAVNRIRIVQLSDVHLGQIVREKRVQKILAAVAATAPDILVSTGDLVDGHQRHLTGLDNLFAGIKPRLGKYAIVGNHEYYAGVEKPIEFMKKAGFKVLINENYEPGDIICITGVDDSRDKMQQAANNLLEKDLLQRAGNKFRLLLKHRPVLAAESAGKFDLQLSGHVHKGQIFPFNFLTWLSFPVKTGLTLLDKGHYLYVSRGTGVWGPPIRFLAPPEVTVIDLIPDKALK